MRIHRIGMLAASALALFLVTAWPVNAYENNSQEQTQNQGAEINVNHNGNYVGINQEQTSGSGVESSGHPALDNYNNRNENGYDSSIQPGQVNPSCKIICLTIIK